MDIGEEEYRAGRCIKVVDTKLITDRINQKNKTYYADPDWVE